MATNIKHKRSSVAGKQPLVSQLQTGELALNTADGKVFLLRDDNTVQDITQRIFDTDSEVRVDDKGDSSQAQITMTVNANERLTITDSQISLKDAVTIEDANTLTFKELTASGDDGITIKAPDTLDAGYSLTLPPRQGTVGQLLAIDAAGNLFFNDADIFGGNVIYVSAEQGDDANDGQSAPVKTIKRACQIASGLVYNPDGSINFRRVNVKVAVGDYTEDNPVIIPDNTVVKGDGLRGCIVRPKNANLDMFRVRNGCYFGEFTFRDGVDENQVPLVTFDYAVAFDDPFATDVTDRNTYPNLPNTRPTITVSPYIQNASIISFLGGSGCKIDGAKVQSPNTPVNSIEAENPVVGAIPEQGKSMVANAFTMLQFGGTGWRLLNDAYAQIVSCFQIFLLNGIYCQSGGYCSITNSATNFGLYSLRSSGYSPKAFQFDRAFVTATGAFEGKQTVSIVGINRDAPVEEFVLRFRDGNYKTAYQKLLANKDAIADATVNWINAQVAAATTPSIWAGFTYNEAKCRRDTALLIDAIRFDILFNSNWRSVSAALRYFAGQFDNLVDQLDQHIAAFAQAKTFTANVLTDATAISRSNALWDEIIEIIQNGSSTTAPGDGLADTYTRPIPTGGTNNASDAGILAGVNQVINNKQFIVDEVSAWIADQVTNNIAPFSSNFVYNQAACEKDVGLIVDALIYDLTYGGNLQTEIAAEAYFVGSTPAFKAGQKEETLASYERLKTVIGQVIREQTVTTSPGNTTPQDTSAAAGSNLAGSFGETRIQEIIDYITGDGASAFADRIEPDVTWVTGGESEAYAALDSEAAINIAQNVTKYINEQIQANIWYGFTYDQAKCRRDTVLIVEAAAQDTWDTGNRYSRAAGLAYYRANLRDSSVISISGQELQTIAAIDQAKIEALTYLTDLPLEVQDFAGTRFDVVADIINDPNDTPDYFEVSSAGDLTNSFKTNATETVFDAATAVNNTTNIFTIVGHGFSNGQKVIYDPDGNTVIGGLDAEQTYYINIINDDEFTLTFDDSLEFPVNIFENNVATGTHKFLSGVIEFYVEEIISSHTTYQRLELESGAESYTFIPGRQITGTTGALNNSAIVASWEPEIRELVVSIEEVTIGSSTLRVQFDVTSTITEDHSGTPNTAITLNDARTELGLGTATFTITATDGSSSLTNTNNLPEKALWFHRPSIVNSSSHTWEYAGSGTDYNALPQNGGNTRSEYEQFEELPGRCYSSGTNELGDFKVGDFITAFNRTGNITFRNKVQVDELDALRLSLSDVAIEEISTSVNLGDDEIGGPSNSRLPTQLAVRQFISNRLGGFVDKTVSTAAVPGAIVQLNTNGQLNADLIPATRQFTNTNTDGYQSRLLQVDDIPAIDLKAGDIATENYEQVELNLNGNINATDGDIITQPGVTGAIGYAKGTYVNSSNILVATIGGAWDETDDSTGDPWEVSSGNLFVNGVDSGISINSKGVSTAIIDNWFLRSSNSSQYLLLDNDDSYVFTSTTITDAERTSDIATITTTGAHNLVAGNNVNIICTTDTTFNQNGLVLTTPSATTFTIRNPGDNQTSISVSGTARTIVTSADGNAQGAVTELREGILTNVDNGNITAGNNYTPLFGTKVYKSVPFVANTGTGTGATADVTVTAGQITDVDIRTGGTGYAIGDLLSVNAGDVGGTGSGFEIEVTAFEKRLYVNILGGELFVASASSIDFVEDNIAVQNGKIINLDDQLSHNFLAGTTGGGGAVDYNFNRITIPNHGYGDGDPVTYNTLGNVAIGGLINGNVYYVKVIDNSTIELYEGFALLNQVEFLTTPANNNHNITRFTVNTTDNSITVINHGLTTGDAVRILSLEDGSTVNSLPEVNADPIPSGSRFFVGSVTDNSFTLHALRSDALSSINDLVTNARDLETTGVGSAEIIANNVQVIAVVNTSSRLLDNWNTLAVTNIDAENIISGTISPSRLASGGVASTDTFLRGDSSYQPVVQKLKKAATVDNPITLTGTSLNSEFYGEVVNIGIANADFDIGGTFSTLGTARFLQTQFDVNADGSGEVFIKDGVVDAGTLDGLDSAYFLNPANLTSAVPVSRGGTDITTYAVGDVLYAQSTGSLNTLNIGRNNSFLKSNGTTPEWGTALDLSEGLDVGSATLTSSSVGTGQLYNKNVTSLRIGGDATNITIGNNTSTRSLLSFVNSYEATTSQNVVVNLDNFDADTNGPVANGENEVPISDTTGILAGMIVQGSASIPPNTTVSGVTAEYIYLSNDTTGTILTGTTLNFTYTPFTIGVAQGDSINISGSGIANLDGTWPVVGATDTATSFTIQTDANVTADPLNAIAGTINVDNNLIIRNTKIVFGDAEASATPSDATIKGSDGYGLDVSGGALTIEAGIGTGNATGGDLVFKTGEVSTTSDIQHTSTERLRINTSGKATFTGEVAFAGDISTNATTVGFLDTTATTINMGGEATTIEIGAATGTTTIHNNVDIDLDLNVDGGDITTNATTFNLINTNATTLNIGGAATTVNIGTGGVGGGTTTIGHDLVVTGDLTVNGTTTTVNSTTISVDDKNIELGSVDTPTDTTADGGGITLKGTTDKTLNWVNANAAWTSSENFDLASGKVYRINNASVLSSTTLGTGVVNSSLQSVGTISIGTWQGTIISPTYGGTGVNNGTKTITLGGNFTHSGAHSLTLTTTGNTSLTLPTSGTVAVSTVGLGQFASTTSADLRTVISDETGTGALVFAGNPTFTTGVSTSSATFNVFNTTATTVNAFGAGTTIGIGASTGTTTINNDLKVTGNLQIGGLSDLAVSGSTFTLANSGATTVNAFGAATDINMGAATGDFNIKNSTTTLDGNLIVNGNTIDTDETGTFNLLKDNTTLIAFGQAARQIVVGETYAAAVAAGQTNPEMIVRLDLRTNHDMYIDGDLFVSAINNTPIGNVTPNSGAFTTLAANDFVTFTDATNATGATWALASAAVKITGGLWVQKDIRADNFIGDIDASYITSGTIPDARIQASGVTQHQLSITGTGALNAGSITSGFGNINIGSSIFTGDGSGLSNLNASNLATGTVPDARIAASSITQHQASITGTGALDSGSITSNFGDINIGTSTFTGNGSGLTTLSASNLTTGTVSGNRLGGNQTMAGIKTFSDTTEATTTANGAVRLSGGLSVAKNIVFGGTATGNGSGLTSLDASNLGSGTVPSARVSGTYSGITGTGALDAGQITSNFGNIDIGTSTFTGDGSGLTGVDADTLDGIDSTGFIQTSGGTMTGTLTINNTAAESVIKFGPGIPGSDDAHIEFRGAANAGVLRISTSDDTGTESIEFGDYDLVNRGGTFTQWLAMNRTTFTWQGNTIWHAGNDGTGSTLDADLLDGVEGSSFLRSDANDSFSGTLSGTGSINITGDVTAANFTGNGSGLTGITADDANTLDGIDSTGFLRSTTTADQNHYIRNASPTIYLRDTDHQVSMIHQNSNIFYILRGATDSTTWTQVTGTSRWPLQIDVSTNDMTTGGSINARTEITAYGSDERLKENIRPIENALDKIKQLDGVFYDWKDMVEEVGFFPKRRKDEAGVLAQQVEKVLPQAVALAPFDADWTRNPDGSTDGTGDQYSVSGENYLTVKYEKLAPLFIEAIKEQDKIIQDQQKQIDELKEIVQKLLDK